VNVKTANDLDHECETRQGSDAMYPPLDGSESWTETAIGIGTSTGEEMAATETSIAILMMILGAGETTANGMSAWLRDANSGTKNTGKGSANAKRSVIPESVNGTLMVILTVPVIENATVGSQMNVIQGLSEPTDAIGMDIVETRTETSARIREPGLRKKNPLGWTPTSPATRARVFLVVKLITGNWMAFRHGSWE